MVLVFDVCSWIAMFRKPYTTTSAVSYPFPPPTAVAGLIGAITGLDNGGDLQPGAAAYWQQMSGLQIAIGLRRPVDWWIGSLNLLEFKTPNGLLGSHIRVKHQFVKYPKYRIYVQSGEYSPGIAVYRTLRDRLSRGEFVYTPYLGAAFCLADVDYVGEFDAQPLEAAERNSPGLDLATVLPVGDGSENGPEVEVTLDQAVHREVVPFRLGSDRALAESVTVLYVEPTLEPVGRPENPGRLKIGKPGDAQIARVGGEPVAWFKPW